MSKPSRVFKYPVAHGSNTLIAPEEHVFGRVLSVGVLANQPVVWVEVVERRGSDGSDTLAIHGAMTGESLPFRRVESTFVGTAIMFDTVYFVLHFYSLAAS